MPRMGAGSKILQGLKEAAAGDFARVTIEGQRWVREDALIAAAPELYEALKEIRSQIQSLPRSATAEQIYQSANAALTKAGLNT